MIGIDRIGNGLRTAPRDALMSLSGDERSLGAAFGVHRAMDTLDTLGPLAAFLVLWAAPGRYDAVFVTPVSGGVPAVPWPRAAPPPRAID